MQAKGQLQRIWKQKMVHLCSDRFAWRIKEVDLCIILYRNIWRIYVNLCTLIWMQILLGRKYYFMLSRCRTIMRYIECDVRNCIWTYGQVVMLQSSQHSLGHVPEVMGSNLQLEKSFFFSKSPPDIRHEPRYVFVSLNTDTAVLRWELLNCLAFVRLTGEKCQVTLQAAVG